MGPTVIMMTPLNSGWHCIQGTNAAALAVHEDKTSFEEVGSLLNGMDTGMT